MLQDLASQHSDRPREISDITGWKEDMGMDTEAVNDRTRYEEENFMRISVTKVSLHRCVSHSETSV